MTKASCGGTCGLATSDTQKCTPIPISCQVSEYWSRSVNEINFITCSG